MIDTPLVARRNVVVERKGETLLAFVLHKTPKRKRGRGEGLDAW